MLLGHSYLYCACKEQSSSNNKLQATRSDGQNVNIFLFSEIKNGWLLRLRRRLDAGEVTKIILIPLTEHFENRSRARTVQ
jgi:hypothetical protein